jgi:hypothetical protein
MSEKLQLKADEANTLPDAELERVTTPRGFNGLTPSEWASLSKNVWNDLSSPRNKYQLEHGAVFCQSNLPIKQ